MSIFKIWLLFGNEYSLRMILDDNFDFWNNFNTSNVKNLKRYQNFSGVCRPFILAEQTENPD